MSTRPGLGVWTAQTGAEAHAGLRKVGVGGLGHWRGQGHWRGPGQLPWAEPFVGTPLSGRSEKEKELFRETFDQTQPEAQQSLTCPILSPAPCTLHWRWLVLPFVECLVWPSQDAGGHLPCASCV